MIIDYKVKKGDTVPRIKKRNGLKSDKILIGQKLEVKNNQQLNQTNTRGGVGNRLNYERGGVMFHRADLDGAENTMEHNEQFQAQKEYIQELEEQIRTLKERITA